MITAFLTGFLGSLHCLGMCGPLALAAPGDRSSRWAFVSGRLLYNLGRITTYALAGALVSLVGVTAALFELQQIVSVVTGGLLIVWVLGKWAGYGKHIQPPQWWTRWVRQRLGTLMQQSGNEKLYLLGMLNGLLPCGLLYIGLWQAAMATSVPEGMARMALFGLGTWPMMLGIGLSAGWWRKRLQGRTHVVLPVATLLVGTVLVVRGLALGIPYLSPRLEYHPELKAQVPDCHAEAPPLSYPEQ